jgi:hypothetical protein
LVVSNGTFFFGGKKVGIKGNTALLKSKILTCKSIDSSAKVE